jgi:hypothetical protein
MLEVNEIFAAVLVDLTMTACVAAAIVLLGVFTYRAIKRTRTGRQR